jgi:hypothetical protein
MGENRRTTYTISEAARELGISIEWLRAGERRDLLLTCPSRSQWPSLLHRGRHRAHAHRARRTPPEVHAWVDELRPRVRSRRGDGPRMSDAPARGASALGAASGKRLAREAPASEWKGTTVRKAVCAPDAGAFCGVDLDACVDLKAGGVASWAEGIVQELDSYAEFSPSGTGLYVLLGAHSSSSDFYGYSC